MCAGVMRKPLMRIPYTELLPSPQIIPPNARSFPKATAALQEFFATPVPGGLPGTTIVLSGAGLSVASGLADYRGESGTYRVNKTYRPIYYHEFLSNHEARKRYWARSFLGWSTLQKAKPNAGHYAVGDMGRLGLVHSVITQNVDSFHAKAHPDIPTIELHGYLRSLVCTSCHNEYPRDVFQRELARLNPAWADFLQEVMATGALETENPAERTAKGMRTNPDGDVELPDAPYTTFRYPVCPTCLSTPPLLEDGSRASIEVDHEGAWKLPSSAGILKPAVVMFGESIASNVKTATEEAVDHCGKLLVLGTSLATYSAWRIAKRAKDRGMSIAVINMGGVRGEDQFFADLDPQQRGGRGVRVEMPTEHLLPALVKAMRRSLPGNPATKDAPTATTAHGNSAAFRDMMS